MKFYVKNIFKLLGLIALVLAINSALSIFLGWQEQMTPVLKWFVALLYVAVVVLAVILLWKWYQKGVPQEKKDQKMGWKDIGIIFLFYLAGRVVAVVGTLVNQFFSGNSMSNNDQTIFGFTESLKDGFIPFSILFVLVVAFVAPLIEELVFRGLGSQLLFPGGNKVLASLVTSLIFALLHATNIIEILMYFGIGMLFYMAYARRGNIKDSICLHVINNIPPAIYLAYIVFS